MGNTKLTAEEIFEKIDNYFGCNLTMVDRTAIVEILESSSAVQEADGTKEQYYCKGFEIATLRMKAYYEKIIADLQAAEKPAGRMAESAAVLNAFRDFQNKKHATLDDDGYKWKSVVAIADRMYEEDIREWLQSQQPRTGIDLPKLETEIDELLESETPESLHKWMDGQSQQLKAPSEAKDFTFDQELMEDFYILTKEQFLNAHPEVSGKAYELTRDAVTVKWPKRPKAPSAGVSKEHPGFTIMKQRLELIYEQIQYDKPDLKLLKFFAKEGIDASNLPSSGEPTKQ